MIAGLILLFVAISAGLIWMLKKSAAELNVAKQNLERFKPILDLEREIEANRVKLVSISKDVELAKANSDQKILALTSSLESEIQKVTGQHEKTLSTLSDQLQKATKQHEKKMSFLNLSVKEMSERAAKLEADLRLLNEDHDLLSAGFYKPRYDFEDSERYQAEVEKIRAAQKQMIKDKKALICQIEWKVGGSAAEGKKMTDRNIKLGLSAFNVQCDNEILSVRFDNIDKSEAKLHKIRENVDKLLETNKCEITDAFFKLKVQELFLVYEYREKKQKEKEEQKALRDQMREEEKALRDAERAQAEAAKEEKQFLQALEKAKKDMDKKSDDEKGLYAAKIAELEAQLEAAHAKGERAKSMAEFTRRGHVYIISNIGSFGEHVYKIGMTRRLDPMDRVWELSDASVPFDFDVHAIIPTEDAPALERKLHDAFADRRMNRVNERKEFFKVSLEEIALECRKTNTNELRLTLLAEAKEYRQSIAVESSKKDKKAA